jgi:hypothetical protein
LAADGFEASAGFHVGGPLGLREQRLDVAALSGCELAALGVGPVEVFLRLLREFCCGERHGMAPFRALVMPVCFEV